MKVKKKRRKSKKERVRTTTKIVLYTVLGVSLVDLQLTYVLAFMDKIQVVESLSSTIATTLVAVIVGYFAKAFAETFAEKREERLRDEQEVIE